MYLLLKKQGLMMANIMCLEGFYPLDGVSPDDLNVISLTKKLKMV